MTYKCVKGYCMNCHQWVEPSWHDSPEELVGVPPELRGHGYDDPECPICHSFLAVVWSTAGENP